MDAVNTTSDDKVHSIGADVKMAIAVEHAAGLSKGFAHMRSLTFRHGRQATGFHFVKAEDLAPSVDPGCHWMLAARWISGLPGSRTVQSHLRK
jgi:hypothetical protein